MIIGIFVGGRGTRMGGAVKGLLPSPDTGEPLVQRLARVALAAVPGARIVLVGEAGAFARFGIPVILDDPPDVGPLGGLSALLREGSEHDEAVLALAADLPHVTTALVARLAAHAPERLAVAPRIDGFWNPLFGRYAAGCAPVTRELLAHGRRSLKSLLEALGDGAAELPLLDGDARALSDWDTPEDVARG